MYSAITLPVKNHVSSTDKYVPLTGVYAIEGNPTGWVWDRRLVEDLFLKRTRYDTYVGGVKSGLFDGTRLLDWQSGSITGFNYLSLVHINVNGELTWTPQIDIGMYSLHHDNRILYSDFSYSEIFNTARNKNGVMTIALRSDCLVETISVAMYRRTNELVIFHEDEYQYTDDFDGEIDTVTNTRLSTRDGGGNIIYSNIAARKFQFVVENDEVILNKDGSRVIGEWNPSSGHTLPGATEFSSIFEDKGPGQESGRNLFADFFPLLAGSVSLYSVSPSGTVTEWVEKTTLNFSKPGDKHFTVDYDLGIITTGGYQAPDLRLSSELDISDTDVEVYPDSDIISMYPEQGVIEINGELILYYNRTSTSFTDCIRGHEGTTPASHPIGSVVSDRKHGDGTRDEFYLGYTAVPKIEYEVTTHNVRSANKSQWLDVKPLRNVKTNNIFQMLSADINLDSITLETSSPIIGGNIYGPVLFGTDFSKLTATGYDSRGNPVDDIELTISIVSGPGGLDGVSSSVTDITNSLGEIYAFYNAPYDRDSIEKTVSAITYDAGNTTFTVDNFDDSTLPKDVWVFQILKHDKILGTVGTPLEIVAINAAVAPYGDQELVIDGLLDESVEGGWLYLEDASGVLYWRKINKVFPTTFGGSSTPGTSVYISGTAAGSFVGQNAWFFQREAREFNPTLLNGVRVILYEWTTEAVHPITGIVGAYSPLHPDSISGNQITFNGRTLPTPDPVDESNNLAAYVVIAPAIVSLVATGKDPVSGRIITSNTIRLQLALPPTLTGVDQSGALPIPYGWTFSTEEFNIGGGLGGANFITINPRASGVNQFSISGSF
jgi:hypothetical protein